MNPGAGAGTFLFMHMFNLDFLLLLLFFLRDMQSLSGLILTFMSGLGFSTPTDAERD